jgi:hypothetical protein
MASHLVSSFEHRFSISHPANVGELPPLAHPGSRPTVCSGRGYLLFRKGRGFPGSTQCGPSRGWSICLDRGRFADALGLTTVHVNRALQQRHVDGLIETKGTQPKIPDLDRLKEVGEFDPTYLHLVRADAAARP